MSGNIDYEEQARAASEALFDKALYMWKLRWVSQTIVNDPQLVRIIRDAMAEEQILIDQIRSAQAALKLTKQ